MEMIPFDQSQLSVMQDCEAKWYEKYVKRLVAVQETRATRGDAAAFGSLVHAGLEVYEKSGTLEIPESTIEEIRPIPELLQQSRQVLAAYANYADRVPWGFKIFEEPLRGPDLTSLYYMMAKVDFAFRVDRPTEVRIGIDEYTAGEVLQPGWYVQEYKTKEVSVNRGAWLKGWNMRPQADFQILCLKQQVETAARPVRGILVTVLEYEKKKPPIRTCKVCKEKLPFASFLELPDGTWQCVMCGGASKLDPIKQHTEMQPLIWKTLVTRTEEQLQAAYENIAAYADAATDLRLTEGIPPKFDTSVCITRWGGECNYYSAHSNWRMAEAGADFVQIDTHRYMKATDAQQEGMV